MPDPSSYRRSAEVYDRIYAFKDYPAANDALLQLVGTHRPDARTLLDVGCGTGIALAHLREHYDVTGTDLSAEMLEVAAERCPDVPLHRADMAELDLGRQFDVITCLFSAIGYVVEPDRLVRTLQRFADHLTPGGLLLVEPWFTPEQYWSGHVTANHVDDDDLKVTWMYVAERDGDRSLFDIHYLVGRSDGVEHFTERHVMGLFTHEQYVAAFTAAGLAVERQPQGIFGRGLYLGRKAAAP